MTAEVAILNKTAVAMASDSAVTVRLSQTDIKIYNNANKLFMLSKFAPVGIMIYNNAVMMGVEWEILIKEYRKKLGNNKFDKITDYRDDFLNWLSTTNIFSTENRDLFVDSMFTSIVKSLKLSVEGKWKKELEKSGKLNSKDIERIFVSVVESLYENVKGNTLTNFTFEMFNDKYGEKVFLIFSETIKNIDNLKTKLIQLVYHIVASPALAKDYTGIVISGYGESEVFPSITHFTIRGVGVDFVSYKIIHEQSISSDNTSMIFPFAQSEMVKSFMEGIDPELKIFIEKETSILFDKLIEIGAITTEQETKLSDLLFSKIDKVIEINYIRPILNTVATLPKSDLAEMAESLVNLTSFKRHVTSNAETVGGPTDVAIISKGDGFIWVKRKHYFDVKLNNHFMENYFKGEINGK